MVLIRSAANRTLVGTLFNRIEALVTERLKDDPGALSAVKAEKPPGVSDHGEGSGSRGEIRDADDERLLDPPLGPCPSRSGCCFRKSTEEDRMYSDPRRGRVTGLFKSAVCDDFQRTLGV